MSRRGGPQDKARTVVKIVEGIEVGRGELRQIVDPEEVYKLAKLHCKTKEIAEWFGIHVATLRNNFGPELQRGYSETQQMLRRTQLNSAFGGNVVMQIWLGKQMLGQKDGAELAIQTTETPSQELEDRIQELAHAINNKE